MKPVLLILTTLLPLSLKATPADGPGFEIHDKVPNRPDAHLDLRETSIMSLVPAQIVQVDIIRALISGFYVLLMSVGSKSSLADPLPLTYGDKTLNELADHGTRPIEGLMWRSLALNAIVSALFVSVLLSNDLTVSNGTGILIS